MGARVERGILGSVAPVAAAQSIPLHLREAAVGAVPRYPQLLSRAHLGGNVDRCLLTPHAQRLKEESVLFEEAGKADGGDDEEGDGA